MAFCERLTNLIRRSSIVQEERRFDGSGGEVGNGIGLEGSWVTLIFWDSASTVFPILVVSSIGNKQVGFDANSAEWFLSSLISDYR